MKVLSVIIFAWSVQDCVCPWGYGASLDSRIRSDLNREALTKAVDAVIEDAVTRNSKPMLYPHRFRPLVSEDWEKDEESIMAMVNEAAHNYKFSQHLSKSYPNRHMSLSGLHVKNKHINQKLQGHCYQVLKLAGNKLFELLSQLKLEDLSKEEFTNDRTTLMLEVAKRLKSAEEKSNSKMNLVLKWSRLKLNDAKDQILEKWLRLKGGHKDMEILDGLKYCLQEIRVPEDKLMQDRLSLWKQDTEKGVFQVIGYMYQYGFIKQEDLSRFFSEDPVLKLTGEHLGSTIFFWTTAFELPYAPERKYLTLHYRLDYMRPSLVGLDEQTQREIIQSTFSSFQKSQTGSLSSYIREHYYDQVSELMTNKKFLVNLSRWSSDSKDKKADEDLANHLDQLIDNFLHPFPVPEEHVAAATRGYELILPMLGYITANLGDREFLIDIFNEDEKKYQNFKNQVKLLLNGEKLGILHRRWLVYYNFENSGNEGVISELGYRRDLKLLQEEMNQIARDYFNLRVYIILNRGFAEWMNHPVIQSLNERHLKLAHSSL